MPPAIAIDKVFQHIGGRCVLDGVTLSVQEGEVFAILGPNGAGKSLLLRLLALLEKPSAGSLQLLGRDAGAIGGNGLAELRREIGVVFQGGSLVRDLHVFDNIVLPLRDSRLNGEDLHRRGRLLMMRLQLDGLEERYPYELSGGLQRRIELARALVLKPRLLLWDEVNDGLDTGAGLEVMRHIEELKQQERMTIILTSHQPAHVLALADRVGVLDQGRLLFTGTPDELRAAAGADASLRNVLEGHP